MSQGNTQVVHAIAEFAQQLRQESTELTKAIISLTDAIKHSSQGNGNGLAASKADLQAMEQRLLGKLNTMADTLDDILKDVTDESTALDSISALITGLKQQVADALAGATLPPATKAKIDQIFTAAETNKAKIVAALAANVPPTP
jgi:DNA anti-recombination protein RmuC